MAEMRTIDVTRETVMERGSQREERERKRKRERKKAKVEHEKTSQVR